MEFKLRAPTPTSTHPDINTIQGCYWKAEKKKHTGKRFSKNNQISIAHKFLNICGIELSKRALQLRVQRAFAQDTARNIFSVVNAPTSITNEVVSPTANTDSANDDEAVPPLANGYDSSDAEDEPSVLPDLPKAAGRPKGTIKEKKRQDIVLYKLCMDAIVDVMVKESAARKVQEKKIAKVFWQCNLSKERRILHERWYLKDRWAPPQSEKWPRGRAAWYYLLLHINLFCFIG